MQRALNSKAQGTGGLSRCTPGRGCPQKFSGSPTGLKNSGTRPTLPRLAGRSLLDGRTRLVSRANSLGGVPLLNDGRRELWTVREACHPAFGSVRQYPRDSIRPLPSSAPKGPLFQRLWSLMVRPAIPSIHGAGRGQNAATFAARAPSGRETGYGIITMGCRPRPLPALTCGHVERQAVCPKLTVTRSSAVSIGERNTLTSTDCS